MEIVNTVIKIIYCDYPSVYTLMTFDELINNNNLKIPNGYKNFQWNNSYVFSTLSIVHSKCFSALTNGGRVSFNDNKDSMSISVRLNSSFEIFNVNSFVAATT